MRLLALFRTSCILEFYLLDLCMGKDLKNYSKIRKIIMIS